MFSGLRSRVPSHTTVVAYLSLFFVLTGGTAFAVTAIDDNSVRSNHIVDGEVRNADVEPNSLGSGRIADNSLTGTDVKNFSIGALDLKDQPFVSESQDVPAAGDGKVIATCPAGTTLVRGGGYWRYTSGTLSGIRLLSGSVIVEGRNRGTATQYLAAFASCLRH